MATTVLPRRNDAAIAPAVSAGPPAAVAPKEPSFVQFLESYKKQIALALPRHMTAERMIRVAITAYKRTPELQQCSVPTIMNSIIQASQLGLEPDGVLGHAYLVPFNTKIKTKDPKTGAITERWEKQCQLIVGYKGLIEMARRSGNISTVFAHEVYQKDEFRYAYGINDELVHRPCMERDRGQVVAYYALARLKDGGYQFEVMTPSEVEEIRQRSKAKDFGPWQTDYVMMGRKTVIRRLMKLLPLSPEIQREFVRDENRDLGVTDDAIDITPAAPMGRIEASVDLTDVSVSTDPNRGHDGASPSSAGDGSPVDQSSDPQFASGAPTQSELAEMNKLDQNTVNAEAQQESKQQNRRRGL